MDRRVASIASMCLLVLVSSAVPTVAVWLPDGVPITFVPLPLASGPRVVSDGAHGTIIAWQDSRTGGFDIYAQRLNAVGVPQWTPNGKAICAASGDQRYACIASDGAGGAIIAWEDSRNGNDDIYAQRVNASGVALWAADGIPVCAHAEDQQSIQIVPDGAGGAIIAWEDSRAGSYDVYAQRVDAAGAILWAGNGIAVCTAVNDQRFLQALSNSGGAIITWQDLRSGIDNDIYAQRIGSDGSPQWSANGIAVCTEAHEQRNPRLASDGAWGAIIAWEDSRGGNLDIYAQRIDADGAALWTTDGTSICTAANDQVFPQIVSDGGAGAIIAWEDGRSTYNDRDIYAQRVDYRGTAQWAANGAIVCVTRYKQIAPRMITDSAGGAIVMFKYYDSSGPDPNVYAQRIDSGGIRQWGINGRSVGASGPKNDPQIDSDGSGGAVFAWESYVDGSFCTIYAERLNASGSDLWNPDGVAVCVRARGQDTPRIASDGAGGAIITWMDVRSGTGESYAQRLTPLGELRWPVGGVKVGGGSGPVVIPDGTGGAFMAWSNNSDIYAQQLDANGVAQWTAGGVAVCTAANSQYNPQLVSDGAGGIIVTWGDIRNGIYDDIYAQRLNAGGVPQWTANGVAVCAAAKFQYNPRIISDGAGGAIVTWVDIRGADYDVYAQRVDASGAIMWTLDGVAVCNLVNSQTSPEIVSDGAGGAIIAWDDYRSGAWDIYAQRFDPTGAAQWVPSGVALCAATGSQRTPQITSDGAGGAIIAWDDARIISGDIYAQRIDAGGVSQWVANGAAICTAAGSQFHARITFDGSGGAIIAWEDLRSGPQYNLYAQRIGADGVVRWQLDGLAVSAASGGQAYHQIASDGAGGAIVTWEDTRSTGYSEVWAQRLMGGGLEPICSVFPSGIAFEDSTRVGDIRDTSFTITNDGPASLGGNVGESCDQFSIVTGEGAFLLSSGQSLAVTLRFQPTEAGAFNCVVTTGIDLCGEVSITALAFSDSVTSGDPDSRPVPKTFALHQNVPNPFNPTTTVSYEVPAGGGQVTLRVYDVAGRMVRTLVDGFQPVGWKSVRWDGTNARGDRLAAGIYFCRMSTVGYRETKKMVLVR